MVNEGILSWKSFLDWNILAEDCRGILIEHILMVKWESMRDVQSETADVIARTKVVW